jgi:hypothetical protein
MNIHYMDNIFTAILQNGINYREEEGDRERHLMLSSSWTGDALEEELCQTLAKDIIKIWNESKSIPFGSESIEKLCVYDGWSLGHRLLSISSISTIRVKKYLNDENIIYNILLYTTHIIDSHGMSLIHIATSRGNMSLLDEFRRTLSICSPMDPLDGRGHSALWYLAMDTVADDIDVIDMFTVLARSYMIYEHEMIFSLNMYLFDEDSPFNLHTTATSLTTLRMWMRGLVGVSLPDDIPLVEPSLYYALSNLCIVAASCNNADFERCVSLQAVISHDEIAALKRYNRIGRKGLMINNLIPKVNLWSTGIHKHMCTHIKELTKVLMSIGARLDIIPDEIWYVVIGHMWATYQSYRPINH